MSRTSLKRVRASGRFAASVCLSLAALLCVAPAADACSWDYLIWMPLDKNADPLYRFIRDGKAGYIDRAGKVVIEPKFEPYGNGGGAFQDGLVEVGVSSGEYADATGKIIETGLYRGWGFSDGLAAALASDGGKWGYIDRTGKFAISPRFDGYPKGYVSSFSEGLAWIEAEGRYGFIDRAGEFVVAPTFLRGDDFHEGMARVVVEGPCSFIDFDVPCAEFRVLGGGGQQVGSAPPCKFTFVDARGDVLEARFDGAKDFSEGLAPVASGGKWGYVDKAGRVVIEPRFEDAWPFSSGRARIRQGELYGFIDARGRVVVEPRFEYADDFSEGLAAVGKLDEDEPGVYYIDARGRKVIGGPFYVASHFFKGLAHVELKPLTKKGGAYDTLIRRFAYIDAKGKTVFAYEVEDDS